MVFVYIAEAHSTDGWQLPANLDDDVLIATAHVDRGAASQLRARASRGSG